MAESNGSLRQVPLNKIRENPVALRPVNRQSEDYQALVDSVRARGVMNPIVVRELTDPTTNDTVYGLIDGLHRFSAAQDAGLDTIPAHVQNMDDADVLEAQIIGNVHKIETKPVQYSKQLIRILGGNPLMTIAQLSAKLNKSSAWLSERLGLLDLAPEIQSLVDEGRVNLSNAYALAKLPAEEQPQFLDQAQTMSPQEFVPTVNNRVKEIKDAKRAGRDAAPAQFVPTAHLRKISELKGEMENPQIGRVLVQELNVKNPVDAFALGIKWALHMDPASIEAARQKDEQRKRELKEKAEHRKRQREEKKAQTAHEQTVAVQEAMANA